MANPQKENGCTDIANELLEAIYSYDFTATQFKIVLCVIRYTYGFKRKTHKLSISYITKAIKNNSKEYVSREIKKLILKNVLIEYSAPSFNSIREIGINKDYSCWISQQLTYKSTPHPEVNTTVDLQVNRGVDLQVNQETKNKETKKETKNIYVQEFDLLWKKYPNKKNKAKAFNSYVKARNKKVEYDVINDGLDKYVEYIKHNNIAQQYIKHGSTWFNNECWNDEYDIIQQKQEGHYEFAN